MTLCSQSIFFCQNAWLGDLIALHNDADNLFHLDLRLFVAYKLDQGNDMFFVALSNPYMLLDLSRQVNCEGHCIFRLTQHSRSATEI